MKKTLELSLSLLLALSLLTACALAETPGQLPFVDEVVEYTIVASDASYIEALNENSAAAWLTEQTNVKLNFIEVPSEDRSTKVNMMLSSNTLPDAFVGMNFSNTELMQYGESGMFIALNDLIEDYGYYYKQVFDEQPTLPEEITMLDGNIYGLPSVNEAFHTFYRNKAWINTTWLDNLGLDMPTTVEEFYDVLVAFRDEDANGNGDPSDEIPMTGYVSDEADRTPYTFLLNSFLHFNPQSYYLTVDENGEVLFAPSQETFKEGLVFIEKLFAEGLIEKEALTQNAEQAKAKGCDVDSAKIGVFPGFIWWDYVGADKGEGSRCREYQPISPLVGPEGVQIAAKTAAGVNTGFVTITSACKNPVPLFMLFDYSMSYEATLRTQIGLVDFNYSVPAVGLTGINGKPALYTTIARLADEPNTTKMQNIWPANRNSDFRLGETADYSKPETKWAQEARLFNATNDYYLPYAKDTYKYPNIVFTTEESDRLAFLRTQINDYVTENIVLFLTGQKNIEEEWDNYLAEYDALGLDEYLEILQMAYDRQYK